MKRRVIRLAGAVPEALVAILGPRQRRVLLRCVAPNSYRDAGLASAREDSARHDALHGEALAPAQRRDDHVGDLRHARRGREITIGAGLEAGVRHVGITRKTSLGREAN